MESRLCGCVVGGDYSWLWPIDEGMKSKRDTRTWYSDAHDWEEWAKGLQQLNTSTKNADNALDTLVESMNGPSKGNGGKPLIHMSY